MFHGSIVALVTPFSNGEIDYNSLEKLIEFQIAAGTDGIMVAGSTGEGLLLRPEERHQLISKTIDIVNKRAPIIAGISAASTFNAVTTIREYSDLQIEGVLVIVPFYLKPKQDGIYEHFKHIHDNSKKNIILYNNPGRCAAKMDVDTIIKLSKLSRIVALKDSDTDMSRVTQIKRATTEFSLLSGDDATTVEYILAGGHGAISVTANIAPKMVHDAIMAARRGELLSEKAVGALARLHEGMFFESNPIPVKYVLHKMLGIKNELRLPLTPITNETARRLDALRNYNMFE